MDRPWKVIAIILVAFLGVLIFTLYEERLDVATSVLRYYVTPQLKADAYVKAAPGLLNATHADVTQLLRLDMNANLIVPVYGFYRTGAPWIPNPYARPLIHAGIDPTFIVDLVAARPVCVTLPPTSPLFSAEYETGIRRVCFVGVPPLIGTLVGLVYIGWNVPPPAGEEYGATETLRTLALTFVNW